MPQTELTSRIVRSLLLAGCLLFTGCLLFSSLALASRNSISFRHIGTQHGLPQSTVNTIFQDSQGFIWIGTYDGLTRFDGYRFVNFKSDPLNPDSLSSNVVVSITEDNQGFLWVATAQNGISRLDPQTGVFSRFLSSSSDFDSLSHPQVNVIHQDSQGRIWVGTHHGLNLFLPEKQAFAHFYHNPLDNQSLPHGSIIDISDDGNGNLWIASNEQLAHFDVEQQVFTRFDASDSPEQINRLYLDTDHSLWIGTRLDGLYHLKTMRDSFQQYLFDQNDEHSIGSNDVRAILRTRNGDLWVGTEEGGLSIRRKGGNQFVRFERNSADNQSLSINDVWCLFQDSSGLIWVGTAGGGLNTTMSFENRLSRITHTPHQKSGLSHEFVWDIEEDNQGQIWFGTLGGLDRYDPETDRLSHFNQFVAHGQKIGNRIQSFDFDNNGNIWFGNQQGQVGIFSPDSQVTRLLERHDFVPGYVSNNRIRMIEKDLFGLIWIGTDEGLLKVDPASEKIIREFNFAEFGQLGESPIRTMLQDENGIFWFGTWDKGLQRFDPEFGTVINLLNRPGDKSTLSDNTVRSLYKDNQGNLWVGTFNGLNLLTAEEIANKTFNFTSFSEKDGLPNSAIYAIVGDTNGRLWLSTNNGLSEFDPKLGTFNNYSIEDGITSNEFNGNAAVRSKADEIYFGSVSGVTVVNPVARNQADFQPHIRITNVIVSGRSMLPQGVAYQEQPIALDYFDNDLTFEFAALDYRHPRRNLFQYRLLPYSEQWFQVEGSKAVFTNLDPANYRFELRASNSDGVWVNQTLVLPFHISPPLWQTWWAYFLYFAALVALVANYIQRHERKLREQTNLNEHLLKVDRLKDEFLANTSHELRTPLNGIIGIAESLKEGVAGLQNQKTLNHLQLIIDGGKRLSQLVNDILDFKKLTHKNLALQRKAVDLSAIVDVTLSLLRPLAEEKKLRMSSRVTHELPLLYADENRMQQILHNLVGNAIKYTAQGSIEISARASEHFVEICVTDSGIGIDASQLDIIFEPFHQANIQETISHRGTGLGLSVTKQLIEQHGGNLWVNSQLGKGSQFFFEIPIWLENIHEREVSDAITSENATLPASRSKPVISSKLERAKSLDQGRILIADDDPINLQVLTDLLEMKGYEVESAVDGLKAVKLGLERRFDLAIIDIMMPGMSGYEVCKTLRQKYSPIELPILLLSARNQPGDIRAGFEVGANDYVTKPIEREILLSRIHTMKLIGGLVEAKQQQVHALSLQQACERMGKYFPKQMVRQIITNDQHGPLVAKRKQITILFADMAGFTTISDRFEPEAITDILNSFLGKMGLLVEKHNGILNEILGDGLVVLFGALDNLSKQEQAQSAAALALDMQESMKDLSEQWLEAGFDHNVKLRIGIHQDFATVGNFGSQDIVAFRAVGSGINLAARLENFATPGEIIVSYPIFAQCREQFNFTELEEIQFKGFNHAHRVCRLLSPQSL